MASIAPNKQSMNGINSIQASNIQFSDGTVIDTNDFASQAAVTANATNIAANTASIASLSADVANKQDAITFNTHLVASTYQDGIGNLRTAIHSVATMVQAKQDQITTTTDLSAASFNDSGGSLRAAIDANLVLINGKALTFNVDAPLVLTNNTDHNVISLTTTNNATQNSTVPITSGGAFTLLAAKQPTITHYQARFRRDHTWNGTSQQMTIGNNYKLASVPGTSVSWLSEHYGDYTLAAGTYQINVHINFNNLTFANRIVPFVYVAESSTETFNPNIAASGDATRSAFCYLRHNNYGVASSINISYIKTITSSSVFCVRALFQRGGTSTVRPLFNFEFGATQLLWDGHISFIKLL